MSKYHILIDKFIDGSISSNERLHLERWILESEVNLMFFKNYLKNSNRKVIADFDADFAYQKFNKTLKSKAKTTKVYYTVMKYAAVLTILLTVGFLAKQQLPPNISETSTKVVENDIKTPIGNKVIIKLPDGTNKLLSPEGDELIKDTNGKMIATKGNNSLSFDETDPLTNHSTVYNEIIIPYGQTFKLKLSDGTLVWLNAGSKLRFPQSFMNSDKYRIVYLEGEAFFDVAKNKNKPFIVNSHEVDVKVLGTQFNISAYETDSYIATTLVEGSVSVYETRTPENGIKLTPDYQASYDKFGNQFNKAKVDTDIYTAWVKNRLIIDNLKFSEILVKLERRYAVKFVNQAESLNDEIYKGEFADENIESILKTISLSTFFQYEINQNVITITK